MRFKNGEASPGVPDRSRSEGHREGSVSDASENGFNGVRGRRTEELAAAPSTNEGGRRWEEHPVELRLCDGKVRVMRSTRYFGEILCRDTLSLRSPSAPVGVGWPNAVTTRILILKVFLLSFSSSHFLSPSLTHHYTLLSIPSFNLIHRYSSFNFNSSISLLHSRSRLGRFGYYRTR